MKKYIYILAILTIFSISGYAIKVYNDMVKYKNLYSRELINVEAYEHLASEKSKEIREFQLTMDEFKHSKDSVNRKLLHTIDSLKIKTKNIQYLQYNTNTIHKTDTIIIPDTIFKEPVALDTIVGDKWYSMKLELKYPSTIITEPTFKSEKQIIINSKKEYDKTPSKIFFIRWFQKKHTVVKVDIVESNPYIESNENRFIKIIK